MMTAAATTTTLTVTVALTTVQQALALSALATAFLIGLLVAKELLLAYAAERRGSGPAVAARGIALHLNAAILPLSFVFGLVVLIKVASVL